MAKNCNKKYEQLWIGNDIQIGGVHVYVPAFIYVRVFVCVCVCLLAGWLPPWSHELTLPAASLLHYYDELYTITYLQLSTAAGCKNASHGASAHKHMMSVHTE